MNSSENSSSEPFDLRSHTLHCIGCDEINDRIAKIIENLGQLKTRMAELDRLKGDNCHREVVELADDFYAAYWVSRGHLTRVFGTAEVLRVFRSLAEYYPTTDTAFEANWPDVPDTVVIYRGGRPNAETLARGMSWTNHPEVARTFIQQEGDLVIRAEIRKQHILAYLSDCHEVIPDPDLLEPGSVQVVYNH